MSRPRRASSRPRCIFLIGPGGTGKSSTGPLLAAIISATFVDLDLEVCDRIMDIPRLVETLGYAAYCEANAEVAEQLVEVGGLDPTQHWDDATDPLVRMP